MREPIVLILHIAYLWIPLGLLAGSYKIWEAAMEPLVDFIRYMPAPAFGTLMVIVVSVLLPTALLTAVLMPRGPVTATQALVLMGLGVFTGVVEPFENVSTFPEGHRGRKGSPACAERTQISFTALTPVQVLKMIGNIDTKATSRIVGKSPSPNQSRNRGASAKRGMALSTMR